LKFCSFTESCFREFDNFKNKEEEKLRKAIQRIENLQDTIGLKEKQLEQVNLVINSQ
jgi:hypothetical protein